MKEAAQFLAREKHHLTEVWEERARRNISASSESQSLSLRDHVPELLDDIVEVMNQNGKQEVLEGRHYGELIDNSREHGRHRASSSGYNIDQILREFIVFHQVLIEQMQSAGVYTQEAGIVLQFTIENAMLYSATAFNETLLEMRQRLMGVLAHDMRNPLAVARVAMDVMEKESDPEKLSRIKKMGRNGLDRALKLLENLLDTVSIKAGEGIVLNFTQTGLMEEIRTLHREAQEIYSNEFRLISSEETLDGIFDGTMVRRALENLLGNAVKYGTWNGPITITLEDSGDLVKIGVHNVGNPISEEQQLHIFDFLHTSNGNGAEGSKSWGMGLPLVVAVARAHGGNLEVSSSEEEGTTFSLSLRKSHHQPGKKRVTLNFGKEATD